MRDLLAHPMTFPTVLIVLDICAAVNYSRVLLWWKVTYWVAAAVLTAAVTYGME